MEVFINFVNGLGIMALVTGAYAIVQRRRWARYQRHLMAGLVFGIGATLMMFNTTEIAPGVILDSRNLFIGFAGAFLGPIGAAASLLVAAPVRLGLGGGGAGLGVASMVIAAIVGVMWNRSSLLAPRPTWWRFPAMGLTISVALVTVAFLPAEQRLAAFGLLVPVLVVFNVLGALLFGAMIERERALTREQRALREETLTDPLTGALNRRGLARHYQEVAPQLRGRGGAFLLMDLDHFKAVNDTHGHAIGDEVLRHAVQAVRGVLRAEDCIARLGGEEFAIVLPGVQSDQAFRIAERIRARVAEIVLPECPGLQVTTSLGLLPFRDRVPGLSDAIRLSDAALYAAKEGGRNRTVTATLSPQRPAPRVHGLAPRAA
ncbi:GGDEF domain-containing protein [Wenxinia saemankumensis]|uniref:diguanylate cyclase n=1 Tax=Wenxinia saemankumensis TaxID=1447782 RepID=A0A1M6FKN4_9RHOB|nr:diguanylate cyclase [Wenxinia saemankumensis]SHI98281.1 diguanylate cyclase [Wenxinia saemankumensis]